MPLFIIYILVFILGAIFGSFISALSFRLPKRISINKGRSFCDECGKQISWYDNIPILSYSLLRGKCRNCGKKISLRYPLIEIFTAFSFLSFFAFYNNCHSFSFGLICSLRNGAGHLSLPYLIIIIVLLTTIFIIDLEHQIILDELIFTGVIVTLTFIILFSPESTYIKIASGFTAATFLLILNIVTGGKGMGLGDVKFAILGGMLTGGKVTVVWLFLSFISGALIGMLMILLGKAQFGKHIPFGPFLVTTVMVSLMFGEVIAESLLPFF